MGNRYLFQPNSQVLTISSKLMYYGQTRLQWNPSKLNFIGPENTSTFPGIPHNRVYFNSKGCLET